MKLNSTVRYISLLFVFGLLLFVISYSSFLQIPVVKNQNLVWQSIIEEVGLWLPFIFIYPYLFRSVTNKPVTKRMELHEEKSLIPAVILVLSAGISIGIHISSQLIEDSIGAGGNETFIYRLSYFLDEYLGHLFMPCLFLLGFILILLELNREKTQLAFVDDILLVVGGIANGIMTGIFAVEGGSVYIILIPLTMTILFVLWRKMANNQLHIRYYPYTKYYFIVSVAMIITSLLWVSRNGFFVQPSDLYFELFNLK